MTTVEHRMLIDGELLAAEGGRTYENVNPATQEVIGTAPDATRADVERAIGAARRAFDEGSWATDVSFRVRCLNQLQAQLRKNVEEIRTAHTAETGMPVTLAQVFGGVDAAIDHLSHYADLIEDYAWERTLPTIEIRGIPSRRVVRREPAGVVSAITPWNFPFQLNLTKIGSALAAGCTVVLKPAPETPWSGTMLAAAVAETDIPPGVLNIVTTSDNEVAEAMTNHRDVDAITFTGSTATGRRIMRNASDTIKRLQLELGGKSPAIVLDDADLEAAVQFAVTGVCIHAGQGCVLQTRLLLPRSRMAEAAEIAAAAMAQIPYGDPTDPANLMGPQINQRQYDKVLGYLETGKQEGRLVCGGGPATQFDRGWFIQPTVFTDLPLTSRLVQEEIFGPVLVLIGFDDDDDAVRIANDTPYGLSGGVFSGDEQRAASVANRLRVGTVSVNMAGWYAPDSPFGGYKQSGLGREWGIEGLETFLESKVVGYPA